MPVVIQAYFDPTTEQLIRANWQELADTGVAPFVHGAGNRPHLSLVAYEEVDLAGCRRELTALAAEMGPIAVTLSHLGAFLRPKAVVFVGPTMTSTLLALHRQIYSRLESFGRLPQAHYLPENWVPHCTLAFEPLPERIPAAVGVCQSLPLPIEAQIIQIGLIQVRPVVDLFTVGLAG